MRFAKKVLTHAPLALALAVWAPTTMPAADHTQAEKSAASKTIKKAQKKLKKAGHYSGKADGVNGPETAEAVREFQQSKGLPETGQLDGRTLAALGVEGDPDGKEGPLEEAAEATESGVKKAASATEKGVKKAASATEKGVRAGGEATGEGLQKAGGAVEDAFDKDDKATQRADEVRMTADETRTAQQKLKAMGHYNGKVDGVVGSDTEAAIRAFQKEKNLPETGRLDGKTRAALGIQ